LNVLFDLIEAYSEKAKVLYKLKRWAEAERTLLDCTRLKDDFLRDSRAHQTAKVSATILLGDLLSKNVKTIVPAAFSSLTISTFQFAPQS
jgi:hypothetical protein